MPRAAQFVAATALVALILLCLAWELWLAPLRPGGSWLALKAAPLALPLGGILSGRRYTFQWTSLLALAYFAEGVVRCYAARRIRCGFAKAGWRMRLHLEGCPRR